MRGRQLFLALTLTGLLLTAAQAATTPAPIAIPGTGVAFEVPEGFQQATPFDLVNEAEHATITILEYPEPSPLPTWRAQMMDHKQLAKRGIKVRHTETVHLSGYEGLLQLQERGRGRDAVEVWKLLLGDMQRSMTIEASYPEKAPRAVGEQLRKALLSVAWRTGEPDKLAGLHFSISESSLMKIAERTTGGVLLRPDEAPLPDPSPGMLVGETPLTPNPGDIEATAKQLLKQSTEVTDIANVSGERFKQAKLEAYELTADARRSGDGKPERIYQLLIFDPAQQRAYVAAGVMGKANAGRYMHEFQAVGRSLKPKP